MARIYKRALIATLALFGVPVALVLLVLGLLLHPDVRAWANERALREINQNLAYHVEIERLERIDPWGLDIRGLSIQGLRGDLVLRVEVLSVRLEPWPLIRGEVVLRRVVVADVRGRFRQEATSRERETPQEKAPDKAGDSLSIRVDALSVQNLAFALEGLPPVTRASVRSLRAAGAYGPSPWLFVSQADLSVDGEHGRILDLHTKRSRWTQESGGEAVITGELAGAALELKAQMQPYTAEDAPRGRLTLTVRDLMPRAWPELGLRAADVRTPITLELRAVSEGQHVDGYLGVQTRRGRAQLRARVSKREASASLYTQSPDLEQISGLLPHLSVHGSAEAQLQWAQSPSPFEVRLHYVQVEGYAVPDTLLRGSFAGETVTLDVLQFKGFEDAFVARGVWDGQQSSLKVALELAQLKVANLASRARMRGVVSGHVDAYLSESEVKADARLSANALELDQLSIGQGTVDVRVAGTPKRPRGQVRLKASGVVGWGQSLSELTFSADGNAEEAHGRVGLRAPDGALTSTIDLTNLNRDVLYLTAIGNGRKKDVDLDFELRAQRDQERELLATALFLSSEGNQLIAHAALDQNRKIHGQVDFSLAHLAAWSSLWGSQLEGEIRGQTVVQGSLAQPTIHIEGSGKRLRVSGGPVVGFRLLGDASLSTGNARLSLNSWADPGNALFTLIARAQVPKDRRGSLRFDRLTHEADLQATLPIAFLTHYAPPKFDGLMGKAELSVHSQGALLSPSLKARLGAELEVPSEEVEPGKIEVSLDANTTQVALTAEASDGGGELFSASGMASWSKPWKELSDLDVDNLPAFELKAELASRRLDKMQGALAFLTRAYEVDLPVRVGGAIDVSGEGDLINGGVRASALVYGDAIDRNCAFGTESKVDLGLDFKDNDVDLSMKARTHEGGEIAARVHTRLLLRDSEREKGPFHTMDVKASGREIELAKLPGLCDLRGGKAAFQLQGKVVANGAPDMLLEVGLSHVRATEGAPVSMEMAAKLDQRAVSVEGQIEVERKKVASFKARAPVRSTKDALGVGFDTQEPLSMNMRLNRLPLAPLLAFGQGLGRPRGTATGTLALGGTIASPRPRADITLSDVGFSITQMAQPLRDINGRITLRDNKLRIESLTARDRSGKARIDAQAVLHEKGTADARVDLSTDEFPLRRQGQVVAELSTAVTAKLQLDAQRQIQSEVFIKGGRLWLTGARGRNVQSLGKHPDVHFADEKADAGGDDGKTNLPVTLSKLKVRTERRLWVMHRDFSVQVSIDIGLEKGEETSLKGAVEIERGNLQLLGRTFDIERGVVSLTGDFPPDPQIELRARYKTRQGDDLFVSLSGRSSAPAITFSGAATSAGEALALLTGAGRASAGAENDAQTDARNFAAGLTAGLLSVTIREELGDWVPVIIIESDETGAPTRGRAGFEASKLIPHFLRPIAKGAYVEGIVGTTDQVGGSVGLGARLEITFPYDFLTSTGYGPGPTWSADLLWAP